MKTLKKIVVLMISAIAIAIGLISINSKVSAIQGDEEVYLKLEEFRQKELDCSTKNNNGEGKELAYKSLTDKVMWKICETSGESAPVVDKYKTIYCIKAGPGFGSGSMDASSKVTKYTKVFDLKNIENIESTYSEILPKGQNYNSLVWVLEHCYVPTKDENKKEETKKFRENLLAEAERFVKGKMPDAGVNIINSGITDNEIDIVQQLAIWHFTNDNDAVYDIDESECDFDFYIKEKGNDGWTDIGNKYGYNGENRLAAAQDLFYYFVTAAANAKEPTPSVTSNPVTLTSDNAKAILQGTNYIIGPYTLTSSTSAEYSLELTSSSNVTLLNGSKGNVPTSDIKNLVNNGDFYISVPSSNDLKSLNITITAKVNQTNLKYRSVADGSKNGKTEQPVVEVTREQSSFSTKVDIPELLTGEISLKLIKVDKGNAQQKLGNATFNITMPDSTKQTKTTNGSDGSVTIDKIVVKEAKDYQFTIEETTPPTGYKSIGTITVTVTVGLEGNEYKITKVTTTGSGVTTEQDQNKTLVSVTIPNEKITGEFKLQLLKIDNKNNNPLNGATFKVEQLTSNGDGVEQTYGNLSTQGNGTVTTPNITISSPKTYKFRITEEVVPEGYYKLINSLEIEVVTALQNNAYIVKSTKITSGGVTNAKAEVSGTSLVIVTIPNEKITGKFDLQLLKTDNTEAKKALDGAVFKVESIGNGNENLGVYDNLTTASGGTVTQRDIPITGVGTYKYRITEVQAPAGYNKIIESIVIDVKTKLQGNAYVVDNTNISQGITDNLTVEKTSDTAIKVTIPNEKITGKFNLELIKYDKNNTSEKLAGAEFKVELLGDEDRVEHVYGPSATDAQGQITIQDIPITGVGTYKYRITETKVPEGFNKIIDSIDVLVTTSEENIDGTSAKKKYVVNSSSITANPQNADGVIITTNADTIQLQIPNERLLEYDLELEKVDISNNTLKLPGAVFEVIIPDGVTVSETDGTKQDGRKFKTLTIGEDGTAKISNIKVVREGEYIFEIAETAAPNTYTKIKETYTLTVVVGLENNWLTIKEQTLAVNNQEGEVSKATSKLNEDGNKIIVTIKNAQFDLALRKFISQIGNVKYDRAPKVNTDNLNKVVNGSKDTTAEYVHPKNAIRVQKGDIITYTIRVYNEGEIDGYVSEATDYIPEELEFIVGDELNEKYGWTYSESDIVDGKVRKIKTDYIKKNGVLDVKTEDRPNGALLKAYNGETKELDYIDLQVKCLVRSNIVTNKKITNIAEITNSTDYDGDKVTDRDSTENSLTNTNSKPEDKNPDDNLPDDEHLPEYKEDEVQSGKEYIPGQQDDDDFEKVIVQELDLALRKFIVKVNNKDVEPSREPEVDVSRLIDGSSTTAVKEHTKTPVKVKYHDTVLYTIRVYNEGEINAYVGEITDYLPEGLEFINNSEINIANGWKNPSGDGKTITTRKLQNTLLKAFNGEELDYKDVQVECKVIALNKASDLKNIAEITEHSDEYGNKDIKDRDSIPDNLTDEQKENYNPEEPEKGKGYEDDDDFEDLVLQELDLALRKFIVKINNEDVEPSRQPEVDVSGLADGSSTTAVKEHPKNPLTVHTKDIVLYTIRVYNEGEINAYVGEITDYLPEGLAFIENSEINNENGWENPSGDGKTITTRKLENTLLKAFNGEELDYADVQVECKVIAKSVSQGLKNIAEITEHSDEDGNKDIKDRDSTPDNLTDEQKENYNPEEPEKGKGYEDDDDFEDLVFEKRDFDLALRKFITAVDDKEVTNRIPQFEIDEEGNYVYKHTKEPVEVENGNIVTYTLRIYNEGEMSGFAEQIKDDLPEGLLYLPENETNIEYRWKMIDENGEETENVEDAVAIVTDYLSKAQGEEAQRDNLLLAFDKETMEEPDHRDIKVAFLVTEPNTSDRILVNEAQISDDADEDGDDVDDKDSTPDEWNEGEDDQDREYVKVKYFDLSLRKWVTQAILIVDGKQTVMDTGHKAEDDPESTVKVELVESKLSRTVLKFKYKIRITNEGEIAGSATEISDYIPKGLRFVQADNPKWKEVDGKVVTDQLKDVILQPRESTEVEIILTWINSKDNFGQMVNTAEISDDWNPSDTPDIDSTPNNKKPKEDDIDDAPVMPSIKTGSEPTYTVLILASLIILGTGLVCIKGTVLKIRNLGTDIIETKTTTKSNGNVN